MKVNTTKIGEKNEIILALFKQLKVHKINGKNAFEINNFNSSDFRFSVMESILLFMKQKNLKKELTVRYLKDIFKETYGKFPAKYTKEAKSSGFEPPQEEKKLLEVFEFLKRMQRAAADIRY